jgi:hypothetical protein
MITKAEFTRCEHPQKKPHLRNIEDFINGNKKFDEVIEDSANVYKEHVNLNKPWSWRLWGQSPNTLKH